MKPNGLKLNKKVCETICEGLRKGNYVSTCCRAVGINKSTYYNWKKKGEEGIEPYATFLQKVEITTAKSPYEMGLEEKKLLEEDRKDE